MSKHERPNSPAGYIVSAVLNGVFLWVMHKLPEWKPFFLLPSYDLVLWAIDMSLIVQIALNIVLVFFHPLFFHYLSQAVFSLVGLVASVVILKVFPVDFSHRLGEWANVGFRIVLIVAIVGSAIGVIVNFVRFIKSLFRGEPREEPRESEREEE